MNRLLFTTITAAVLALCAAATAGDCHHFFPVKQVVQHHAQAVVVPHVAQVVYPQVGYYAGQNIEAEAIAERAAVRALAKFQAVQQQRQPQVNHIPEPRQMVGNIVAEKCGSCHSGAAPKAGLTLDGVTPVPCVSVLESLRQIKDDKMPKGGKLSPEEKGLLMEALLALEDSQ
jgi:hypothetical protein